MNAEFHSIDVGRGDCLFLLLTADDGEQFNIMIDCGTENLKDVEDYVSKRLNDRIDLLIITHIDNDHLQGIRQLLERHSDYSSFPWSIGCIWYNSDEQIENESYRIQPTTNRDFEEFFYSSSIIARNNQWRKVWIQNINTDDPITIYGWNEDKFGTIKILSPTKSGLRQLKQKFQIWYNQQYQKRSFNSNYEELLMIDFANQFEDEDSRINKLDFTNLLKQSLIKEAQDPRKIDRSPANGASIAFEWEYKNGNEIKRYLFLGDAFHQTIINNLKKLDNSGQVRIYDLIKVSHHGSSANTNTKLLEMIDSHHFWITGYTNSTKNRCPALARIVLRPMWNKDETSPNLRHIHFSHRTEIANLLTSIDKKSKLDLNFDIDILDEDIPTTL